MRAPQRRSGYAPIGDYGVIGNERTAALVALDGSIDFMCAPRFDSDGVFAALLDARDGGSFSLSPTVPFEAEHRYLPGTNVLETTFRTSEGTVRVTDAMAIPLTGPLRWEELLRRVEALSGSVPMRWRIDPRFGWSSRRGTVERQAGAAAIREGDLSLVVSSWDAGEPSGADGVLEGEFTAREGARALLALQVHEDQPRLLSPREIHEQRLDDTCEYWRRWLEGCSYEGPWKEAVDRSALALGMLVHAPTGAMMAAATTSLPETIGGSRNFDYRYCWLRDTAFSLEAMLELGRTDQVHATLTWLLRVIGRTAPNLQPFYGIDGEPISRQHELGLEGYRESIPAVSGNDAGDQLQLGNYGDLLQAAGMFVEGGNALGPEAAGRLRIALNYLVHVWDKPDSSIWELPDRRQYTQGKLAAWLAFDRALELVTAGELSPSGREEETWRATRSEIERWIEERCYDRDSGSYRRTSEGEGIDASLLLFARSGYLADHSQQLAGTVDAVERELGAGEGLLYRYSGMEEQEGAFVACSFWLVEGLQRTGRADRAAEIMDRTVERGGDLGLLSEEIDPGSGEFLGNVPQALSHLSLINAAVALSDGD